ncbi:hypothetical protein B1B_00490, partial [mine drainage metagenome]
HFVDGLGDSVFADYLEFRNCVVKTKGLASISKIRIDVYREGIHRAEALWIGVASEYILHPRELKSKFPFALPYVDVIGRCIEVKELVRRIITWNVSHNVYCTPLMELNTALSMVTEDNDVNIGYLALPKTVGMVRVDPQCASCKQRNELRYVKGTCQCG